MCCECPFSRQLQVDLKTAKYEIQIQVRKRPDTFFLVFWVMDESAAE